MGNYFRDRDDEPSLHARSTANPMNSRCGLEDCDCGYVIEKLISGLESAALDYHCYARTLHLHFFANCPDPKCEKAWGLLAWAKVGAKGYGSTCPCYQAGYERERRP